MLHNSLLIQITSVACYEPYLVSVALTPKGDTKRESAGASREEREGTVRTKLVYHVARQASLVDR